MRGTIRGLPAAGAALALLIPLLHADAAPVARATVRANVVRPTAEDAASLRSAADLAISPDGTRLVYALSVATFDPDAKPSEKDDAGGWKRERQLWVVDLDGGEPRQITHGSDPAYAPLWSPDGREIAFVRKARGRAALHLIALSGGEASVVATGALDPQHVRWSPDGKAFAFLAPSEPARSRLDEKWRSGGVVDVGREFASDQIWVVPRAGGEPRRVTRGTDHVESFEWSPDGTRFAVLGSASSDPYEATTERTPRIVSARDGAPGAKLAGAPGIYESLRWSPDGRHVAVLATHQSLSMMNELRIHEVASGRHWNALPDHDRAVSSFVWAPDGRSLIAVLRERTGSRLVRVPLAGGDLSELPLAGRVVDSGVTIDRAGARLAFLSSTDREPRDPTVLDLGAAAPRVVTRLNPQVEQWALGREEVVRWKSGGVEIEGLLMVSPQARPGVPAPLIVFPHGGPDDVSARSFSSLTQFFAAHGFHVFRPNYRGSFGYGREFYAANRGRLGEIEFQDIESGVDALIAAKRADPRRLLYGGWSWGGYLAAWTIGHTTRYRAAVIGGGVTDVFLQYSLSDINHGIAAKWEYLGDPWLQTGNFDRANPIRYARAIRTPTLILHGENDRRVGYASSVALHRALLDAGVPTRFYAYPREPHNFVEPAHLVHRNRVWLEWYQTYLK